MSGGGGSSGQTETRDTSSVKASMTPIDVKASEMRTPTSEEYRPQITHTTQGYYVPPSVIYAKMFGQNPGYYVSPTARSNYDPAKALAMAEQQRAYQNKSAADLATGYNQSLNALAAQREAVIAKQKAEEEEARRKAEESRLKNLMQNSWWFGAENNAAAQGGLASLRGFE